MKKSDLLEVLESELLKVEKDIENFAGNNNPQVKEFYYIAIGKKDILEATIYYAKHGSKLYF